MYEAATGDWFIKQREAARKRREIIEKLAEGLKKTGQWHDVTDEDKKEWNKCPDCGGTGKYFGLVEVQECTNCHGTGKY